MNPNKCLGFKEMPISDIGVLRFSLMFQDHSHGGAQPLPPGAGILQEYEQKEDRSEPVRSY